MKKATLAVLAAASVLCAGDAQAQHRGDTGFTITLGRHTALGGDIAYRDGLLLDILAAGRVRTMPRWSIIAAGGVGVAASNTTDVCVRRAEGRCAPFGNFGVINALAGASTTVGPFSARALAGPALYNGADDTSLGVQARVDFNRPVTRHVGLGAMMRATFLPSHGGARLFPWAVGGSITFR